MTGALRFSIVLAGLHADESGQEEGTIARSRVGVIIDSQLKRFFDPEFIYALRENNDFYRYEFTNEENLEVNLLNLEKRDSKYKELTKEQRKGILEKLLQQMKENKLTQGASTNFLLPFKFPG
ncbi:hypothetical protein CWI37_1632p0010 [Hamiltosporidium tvaerminnensis]|uniref:Uncharacterized protein n=1 Tax=Hamiltosporidium tvaerminnensis TaxID=1176355 RepID=A0A4Q9KX40_9MICR|nr:hypothetical protein CWI37_1632p0010 [Hamiltosporidium tvaerminnensis]